MNIDPWSGKMIVDSRSTTTSTDSYHLPPEELPCQATPSADLRQQIMDSRIPKNEREWWASRHIEELERELAAAREDLAALISLLRAGVRWNADRYEWVIPGSRAGNVEESVEAAIDAAHAKEGKP